MISKKENSHTSNSLAFDMIYVLSTLLDLANEARDTTVAISVIDAEKIIKLLKKQHISKKPKS